MDIEARNSAFDLVFESRPRSNSMASTGESGLSTFRSTHTRFNSSGGHQQFFFSRSRNG